MKPEDAQMFEELRIIQQVAATGSLIPYSGTYKLTEN